MTLTSIFGIAIGVFALIVVLSVMGGFERDLKSKIFRGMPHVEVFSKNIQAGFSLDQHPLGSFRSSDQDSQIEPFTKSDVVLKFQRNLAPVTLFGVDPEGGGRLWGFSSGMLGRDLKTALSSKSLEGDNLPSIILGQSLSIRLGVNVGDVIEIMIPQANLSNFLAGREMISSFRVSGIFLTDLPRYDSKYAIVTLEQGRKFMLDYDPSLDEENYVSGVAYNVLDPYLLPHDVRPFSKSSDLEVYTWKNVNKSLLFALKLEKFTMGAILLLIVLVAAFSISGTMMMLVFYRRNQIALFQSLGMSHRQVYGLFVLHGFIMGVIGSVLGALSGILLCVLIDSYSMKSLLFGGLYLTELPVRFLPFEYGVIFVSSLFLSFLATLYPAYIASKKNPSEGLRYT